MSVALAKPVTVLSLATGVGGIELGLRLAGLRTRLVCAVERDPYAAAVLLARMEDETLEPAPVWCGNLQDFDARPFAGVALVTAGYPCPAMSTAGKRLGQRDPRWLWPEVARVVSECRPAYVFLENVGGHLRLAFDDVWADLGAMGYRREAGLFSAAEVGAPHERERLFVLAHAEHAAGWTASARGSAVRQDGLDGIQERQEVSGAHRGSREEPVEKWEARRASLETKGVNGNGAGTPLTIAARNSPTPAARDVKGSDLPRRNGSPSLPETVQNWPTPYGFQAGNGPDGTEFSKAVRDWPPDGEDSDLSLLRRMISRHGHECSPECLRLNPQFVNWLNGLPPGWTDSECSAMEWFPLWLRMHSERLRAVWESQRILG